MDRLLDPPTSYFVFLFLVQILFTCILWFSAYYYIFRLLLFNSVHILQTVAVHLSLTPPVSCLQSFVLIVVFAFHFYLSPVSHRFVITLPSFPSFLVLHSSFSPVKHSVLSHMSSQLYLTFYSSHVLPSAPEMSILSSRRPSILSPALVLSVLCPRRPSSPPTPDSRSNDATSSSRRTLSRCTSNSRPWNRV